MQRSWGRRVWPKSRRECRREESAGPGAGEEKGEVGGGTWAETSTDAARPVALILPWGRPPPSRWGHLQQPMTDARTARRRDFVLAAERRHTAGMKVTFFKAREACVLLLNHRMAYKEASPPSR